MTKVDKALESVLEDYASFLWERIEVRGLVAALKFPQRYIVVPVLEYHSHDCCVLFTGVMSFVLSSTSNVWISHEPASRLDPFIGTSYCRPLSWILDAKRDALNMPCGDRVIPDLLETGCFALGWQRFAA